MAYPNLPKSGTIICYLLRFQAVTYSAFKVLLMSCYLLGLQSVTYSAFKVLLMSCYLLRLQSGTYSAFKALLTLLMSWYLFYKKDHHSDNRAWKAPERSRKI